MGDKSKVSEILKEDCGGPLLNIKADRQRRYLIKKKTPKTVQWSTKNACCHGNRTLEVVGEVTVEGGEELGGESQGRSVAEGRLPEEWSQPGRRQRLRVCISRAGPSARWPDLLPRLLLPWRCITGS